MEGAVAAVLPFFLHSFLFLVVQLTTFTLCAAMPLEMAPMALLLLVLRASELSRVRALKLASMLLRTSAVLAVRLLGSV